MLYFTVNTLIIQLVQLHIYHLFDPVCDKIYYDQPNLMKTLHATRYAAAALWNKL